MEAIRTRRRNEHSEPGTGSCPGVPAPMTVLWGTIKRWKHKFAPDRNGLFITNVLPPQKLPSRFQSKNTSNTRFPCLNKRLRLPAQRSSSLLFSVHFRIDSRRAGTYNVPQSRCVPSCSQRLNDDVSTPVVVINPLAQRDGVRPRPASTPPSGFGNVGAWRCTCGPVRTESFPIQRGLRNVVCSLGPCSPVLLATNSEGRTSSAELHVPPPESDCPQRPTAFSPIWKTRRPTTRCAWDGDHSEDRITGGGGTNAAPIVHAMILSPPICQDGIRRAAHFFVDDGTVRPSGRSLRNTMSPYSAAAVPAVLSVSVMRATPFTGGGSPPKTCR